jgi:flavin reductase (DIM6/NTAB) family NADH-FMN oxidoreductase RutF
MKSLGASTIALPLPAWVITAYDAGGLATGMTASWTGVCCSKPPCVYFSARENRYTYECVTARRAFCVNIPGLEQADVTDYLGIASGRNTDKLAVAGQSAIASELVDAPYIAGFPLVMECRVIDTRELGSHTMFIGEIVDVKCDESIVAADGKPDFSLIRKFIYSTADSTYYAAERAIGGGYSMGSKFAK